VTNTSRIIVEGKLAAWLKYAQRLASNKKFKEKLDRLAGNPREDFIDKARGMFLSGIPSAKAADQL